MSHYFIECTIEKKGPLCRNSIGTLIEIAFQCVSAGCGWCPHDSWCSDQQKIQHTWPLVTMQACFGHRIKKVKTVIVTFLSHNSDYFGIVSLHCAIQTLSKLWDTVNSQLQEKKSEFWDKVTSTLCPLYSMAEISFHRFHMCKGKKQTNKHKNAQSNTHSHSSPLPLIQLLLSLLQLFLSLSQTLFFSSDSCVVLHP